MRRIGNTSEVVSTWYPGHDMHRIAGLSLHQAMQSTAALRTRCIGQQGLKRLRKPCFSLSRGFPDEGI